MSNVSRESGNGARAALRRAGDIGGSDAGALDDPARGSRGNRHGVARLCRRGVGSGDPPPRGRLESAVLRSGPGNDLVRLRPDRRRDGVHGREGLRLPHQPRGDVRAGGHEAVAVARGAALLVEPARGRDRRRARHLGDVRLARGASRLRVRNGELQPCVGELGIGDVRGSDRHRHPHVHGARHRRHALARRLGRARDRSRRRRDHHRGRPGDERCDQPRAHLRPATRPVDRRLAHAQLDQVPGGLPACRSHRSGCGGVRVRLHRDAAPDPAHDRGSRHRAGPRRGRGRLERRTDVSVAVASVKKFINEPADVVKESLVGLGLAHPDLVRIDFENQLVLRKDAPVSGKVALISGGGSGHEPLHGGFVGAGMLDAACPGEVFTSPVPDQMLAATKAVDGGAGVLHVVKNYTGDVLNFQMAAELASDDGIEVVPVVVNDDVAVLDSLYTAGRRGVGATVFVEKIAGALAERGAPLTEVAAVAAEVNERSRSFGVALTSCIVPAAGTPTFDIGADEMEFGVGIHGEPGRRREKVRPASEIVEEMADAILGDLQPAKGANVLAFVNGLGGTPLIELYLVYAELAKQLEKYGVTATRSLVGDYITSLDMAGVSITLLELDDELTALWDAPVHTPALRWGI